jgi:hypothetical protein
MRGLGFQLGGETPETVGKAVWSVVWGRKLEYPAYPIRSFVEDLVIAPLRCAKPPLCSL